MVAHCTLLAVICMDCAVLYYRWPGGALSDG